MAWAVVFVTASATGCVQPARMCGGDDCGSSASCVAGRCLAHGATAAISTSRRVLYPPLHMTYLRRGEPPGIPSIAPLGGSTGGLLLLRFAVPLPPEATVLEAYLLLERATDVDPEPAGTALHAVRVTSPWEPLTLSWATRPALEDIGAPVTHIRAASGPLVRLDVRPLVERWRRRSATDFGVAVVSEGGQGAGLAFALAPVPIAPSRRDVVLSSLAVPTSGVGAVASDEDLVGPRLELYLR